MRAQALTGRACSRPWPSSWRPQVTRRRTCTATHRGSCDLRVCRALPYTKLAMGVARASSTACLPQQKAPLPFSAPARQAWRRPRPETLPTLPWLPAPPDVLFGFVAPDLGRDFSWVGRVVAGLLNPF